MFIILTGGAGKYRALLSIIFNTVPLSAVILVITKPVPSSFRSDPPVVATYLSVQGIISLNRNLSLTI